MKDGKIKLGDVFEELNMAPDSVYRGHVDHDRLLADTLAPFKEKADGN